ncbi:putative Cytochrome P450 [Quillaja saponaria]|uniref:Cytochrome P450 n=1 Tax=Quillaja saponaria TaxID=32244 RepID=A0AAD7PKL7_QUISA|nr:putative Cytochrome P450 [Quillaja saponaria]
MEEVHNLLIPTSFFLLFFFCLSKVIKYIYACHENFPPSPPALPVIGHLHLLKKPLHQSLHKLTEKYGQILFLRFGTRKVLVVTSPSAVEECFTKNDIIFANRPRTLAGKHLHYNHKTMGSCSYGDHWRNLRRLTTLELFSTNRLASFSRVRQEEVQLLLKELQSKLQRKSSKGRAKTKISGACFQYHFENDRREKVLREGLLKWVDFQGLEKRMVKFKDKMDRIFQNLLDEHRRTRIMNSSSKDGMMTLIDVMLSQQETEPEFYTDDNMKGVIQAMLLAGSETSSTTMEWALSLLLNHPEAMRKAKAEIDTNVGQERLLDESDLPKLKYLQNVITETLRLYPPVPLLIPHESSDNCRVCGFDVPKGTMLLVNIWTMQRDAKLWENPTEFVPERFEGGEGEGYNMIPFGAGRRACPGAVLGKRVVGLALGSLIQSFNWERIGNEEIDMQEGTGITLPKAEPLNALCEPRLDMINLLLKL